MFTEDELKLINNYEAKFGYNPMMEFAFYLQSIEIINLLIEANGREIVVDHNNQRLDSATFSFE